MNDKPWLYARTGGPKGPAPYNPRGRNVGIVQDVIAVVNSLAAADALPVGPRTIGYRLSMRTNPSGTRYAKVVKPVTEGMASFDDVTEVVKRLRQAGMIQWDWISDGSAVAHPAPGWFSPEEFASDVLHPDNYERDVREGQPVVVEIYSESAELTPLIAKTALPYGVRVYSGRGSAGPDLARKVAKRAFVRYLYPPSNPPLVQTLILGVGDFDHAGVQNVMRPHLEHVGAFLTEDDYPEILDFRRLAITPEQAIEVVEAMGDDADPFREYIDSGDDDWSRDVTLLDGAPKVETEALDPVELRDLVIEEIEAVLDLGTVERIRAEADDERPQITDMRAKLGMED